MSTGYITVKVFTAEKAMPVPKAQIRIINLRIALDQTIYTDPYGNAERIKVYAPDKATSLKPQDISQPYETYNIEIIKEGYIPTVINHVPVFAGETCLQPVAMIPQPEGQNFANLVNNIEIPPNGLQLKTEKRPTMQMQGGQSPKPVTVPEFIRVHLGEPDSDNKTVLVPFCDYIKNAASSEVYATWPKESLIANILAIISFALNRIYTGFYAAQGKDFDITSMPDRDPYYVDGRNIYSNICDLVDGIFNSYIKRTGFDEPLLANYCNGITNKCEGISQWGSVTLANQGQSAEDILKYYYGNVQTETTKGVKGVEKEFPGNVLRLGDVGENVMALQKQLNIIGKTYQNIPAIPKENGNFDAYTHDAVQAFQTQFNLHSDGLVGKKTWYQIAFVYNNVKRLQNLSKMRGGITVPTAAPTTTLRPGSTGNDVKLLQYLLSAAGVFYNSILPVEITGNYDESTAKAVKSFQKTFALPQTSNMDRTTWNALLNVYKGIEKQVGAVLDQLHDASGTRSSEEGLSAQDDRRMQTRPGGADMARPKAPEQQGMRDMARSGRPSDTGKTQGRDETRGTSEERIRAAMNYANMDYKAPPRGQMNMQYSSDIKDYVPETGENRGSEFPWTQRYKTQLEKTRPETGPAEHRETDQSHSGDRRLRKDETGKSEPRPSGNQRFQYTPWMTDTQTPPWGSGTEKSRTGQQETRQSGQQQTVDRSVGADLGMEPDRGMDTGRETGTDRSMGSNRGMGTGSDVEMRREMGSSSGMGGRDFSSGMSGREMGTDQYMGTDRGMRPGTEMGTNRGMGTGMDMGTSRDMGMGSGMEGGMDMTDGRSGMQSRQGKPWSAMEEPPNPMRRGGMDQGTQPLPYIPRMMDDENMITRPGTKVTPHRPDADMGSRETEPSPTEGTDIFSSWEAIPAMQEEEQVRMGRQPYPMRMPGYPGMQTGEAVIPGDDGDEEYTCPDPPLADPVFPNMALKIGSKGKSVQLMQEYLSYIALSLMRYRLITNELKVIVNDGIYGIDTTDAVIRFQNRYEMPVNGVIDAATWTKIVEVYNNPCE